MRYTDLVERRAAAVHVPALLYPGGRQRLGRLVGGGEQVAGGQAAVRPPLVRDGEDLLRAGEVVQPVGGPDRLAQGQVAGQHDVLAAQRDDQRALHRPRADPRDRGQLGQPGPGVEVWAGLDQPGQHRIGGAQVRARLPEPRGAAGIPGHRTCSLLPADRPAANVMSQPGG